MEARTAGERSGVEVGFVTGRPPRWVLPIAQLTGHRGVALCGNGAAVLDLGADEVVESHPLSVIDVVDATSRLRTRLPGAVFALETMSGYRREPQFETRHTDDVPVGSLAELLIDHPPVLKVLCRLAPPHRGTTCWCRWSASEPPATAPRLRPTLKACGADTARSARSAMRVTVISPSASAASSSSRPATCR